MDALETSPRFDDELADHQNAEDCPNTKNTDRSIKYALNVFVEFCKANQKTVVLVDMMSDAELDSFLQRFYAEVRQVNGESYCKKSMQAIRYGLQRHFKQREDRPVNIVKDEAFRRSNNAFRSALNRLKKLGKDFVQNKRNPISAGDMERINRSPVTDISTPAGLQNKVFMDIMIYFCNRGRVNIRGFRKTDFEEHRDSNGLRYITKRGIIAKIHGDTDDITVKRRLADIMFEAPGNPRCPVRTFLLYRQKLNPACDFLWQRPKDKFCLTDEIWYTFILGKNTMANKLKVISQAAKCSRIYTNYCFHFTSITVLENAGLQAKDSMNFSQNSEMVTGNRQGGREIPSSSSSDDDGSSSELDDQENPSLHHQAYNQDQDDQLAFGYAGDMEHEEVVSVKEEQEEGEILPDHYYLQDTVGHRPAPSSHMDVSHISQNGGQETVASPSRLDLADQTEKQKNVYPVCINIGPSTTQAPASNQQSENVPPGFDSNSWTVERSWLDENNKRKWLLTQRETSNPTSHGGSEVRNGIVSTDEVRTASGGRSGIRTSAGGNSGIRTSTAYSNGIGTSTGCSSGIMPAAGCCCRQRTAADEQLLQLQMNVLKMQQENLALERRKIEVETAKLEAERLKLESERRKFTIEGNILLRDREML